MNRKNKNPILYFILGLFTASCIEPILEELTNIALSWIEYLKIKPSKLVLKGNSDLRKLQAESEMDSDSETIAVGFHYNPENDDDLDEEYEDEE